MPPSAGKIRPKCEKQKPQAESADVSLQRADLFFPPGGAASGTERLAVWEKAERE